MIQRVARLLPHGALILLGLGLSAALFVTAKLDGDSVQILAKAIRLHDTGHFTHHGNTASVVGFVPGSFLTAVTAGPMLLWFSPYAALAVIALLHLLALGALASALRDLGRPAVGLDLVPIFWLNPWRLESLQLNSPAYLVPFAALHLWTAYRMRERSFGLSLLHALGVGFCAQVHYSFAILALLSLVLWRFRFMAVHGGGVALASLVVLASLVPYLVEYWRAPELEIRLARSGSAFVGRNLLLVYPLAKALAYWVRFGSTCFPRPIFSEIDFAWLGDGPARRVAGLAFAVTAWPLAGLTLLASLALNVRALGGVLGARPFDRTVDRTLLRPAGRLAHYAFYMLAAMLGAVALSPVGMVHWHLLVCFPAVAVLTTLAFNGLRERLSRRAFASCFAAGLVVFAAFGALAALGSEHHALGADFDETLRALHRSLAAPERPGR